MPTSKHIVPSSWIHSSTTAGYSVRATVGPISNVNYAHLWWTADGSSARGFFAWGYGGQFVYVLPALEMVIVATTDWTNLSLNGGPRPLEAAVLRVIVDDVVAAAR